MGWGGGGRTTIGDLTTNAIPGSGFCSLMNVCYNLVYSWFILCFSLTNWAMLETFFSHKTTWGQVLQIIYKLLKQVTFDNNQIPHCPPPGSTLMIDRCTILCCFLQIIWHWITNQASEVAEAWGQWGRHPPQVLTWHGKSSFCPHNILPRDLNIKKLERQLQILLKLLGAYKTVKDILIHLRVTTVWMICEMLTTIPMARKSFLK